MNVKKLRSKFFAILLGMCCVITPYPATLAQTAATQSAEQGTSYEDIFNCSLVVCGGSPYYYQNGKQVYFDEENKTYSPPFLDGVLMISVDTLCKMFDAKMSYDGNTETITVKKGNNVAKLRLGEDALYINGQEKYLPTPATYNGVKTFLPFEHIAKALGYYVYSGDSMFIATNHESFSDDFAPSATQLDKINSELLYTMDFNGVYQKGENLMCSGWTSYDWGTANGDERGNMGYTDEQGIAQYSMYADAVPSSFKGGHASNPFAFDKAYTAYKFNYSVRVSDDYAGNTPKLVFLYYYNEQFVTSQFYDIPKYNSDGWTNGEFILDKSMYPDSDANKINVAIVTARGENTDENTGRLYIGAASLTAYGTQNKDKVESTKRFKDKFLESDLFYGFEEGTRQNWSYYDWGKASRGYSGGYSYSTDAYNGEYSGVLNAVPDSFAGFQSGLIKVNEDVHCYEFRFKYKRSSDYQYNTPAVACMFANADGAYKNMRSLSSIPENNTTEWVEAVVYLDYQYIMEQLNHGYPQFRLLIYTKPVNASDTNIPSGQIMIDDISMREYYPNNGNLVANFVTENYAAWHIIGEDVVFKCEQPEKLNSLKSVTGMVYDSTGNFVYESTQPIDDVLKRGWKWTPKDVGYYHVYLYGNSVDGSFRPIVSYSTKLLSKKLGVFEMGRHAVAVVSNKAKPMEERNETMYISTPCVGTGEDDLHTGDLVGFYGVRIHYVSWGTPAGGFVKGAHNSNGTFDWTRIDQQFENIEKYNYGAVMPNIINTPKWAVSEEDKKLQGNTIAGMWLYNCRPPVDMQNLADFLTAIVNRYKDRKVTVWEFWNEPQMGNTAFWRGEPHEYGEMQKVAYKAIKQADPDSLVTMGSQSTNASYYTFYDTLIQDPEFYNSFDILPLHGTYFPNENFATMAKQYGYEPKPYIDSEGYYASHYKKGKPTDQQANSLYYLICIMSHIKDGCPIITFFNMTSNNLDEERIYLENNNSSSNHWGMFNNNPNLEPELSAVVAFNFMNLMEKDFSYRADYALEDGQKAVAFNNGDNAVLVLWNSEGKNFSLDKRICDIITKDTVVMDFEGKAVDLNNMKPKTAYFISNVDMKKLDAVEVTDNAALNPKFMSPYYTCLETMPASELSDSLPRMASAPVKPFDEKTYVINEGFEWNTADWNWVGTGGNKQPEGFSVRHTARIDKDGLYVLIDVTDSVFNPPDRDNVKSMFIFDSVQLAMDTRYDGNSDSKLEVQIGKTPDGDLIYKQDAPFLGSDLPHEWTGSGNFMKYNKLKVEQTETGTMYKIFIPMSELYPYVHPVKGYDYIRLSLLVNANDGDGRIGYMEWSSGIGASKNMKAYGVLHYPK